MWGEDKAVSFEAKQRYYLTLVCAPSCVLKMILELFEQPRCQDFAGRCHSSLDPADQADDWGYSSGLGNLGMGGSGSCSSAVVWD